MSSTSTDSRSSNRFHLGARPWRSIGSYCLVGVAWVLLALGGGPVTAADYYWDTDASVMLPPPNNTDGSGLGGSGTWDILTSKWWDLANLDVWPNLNTDRALFSYAYVPGAPTANTVTLSGALVTNQLSFLRSGYTLSGGTSLTLAGTTPGLHANLGESATIDSLITGSAGLTKTGGGSVRLTNVLNSYTGATTIANGTLIINSAAALGGTGAVSVITNNQTPLNTNLLGFGGGSLVLDGTSSGFTFTRDINFEGRGPIGDRGSAIISLGNNTLSGTLSAAVSPLPLSPTASFRNSRINSVNGMLTLSGTVNVGGTVLGAGSNAGTTGTITNLGGINSAGVGDYNLTGVLAGGSILEKSGAGTLFLNPSSTSGFSGALRISASATGQQSSVRVTQLTVGGTSIFGTNTIAGQDAASIDMNGGVLEFRNDGNLNFGSLSSGKNVHLRANSTFYTGPAAGGAGINGVTTLGTFRVVANTTGTFNSRNGFGMTLGAWTQETVTNPNTITNNMGGTLTFTGDAWGNTDTTARNLTINGNGNTTIVGSLIASGALHTLTKGGTGNLTIAGVASSLTGAVSITGGTVQVTDFRSLGTASSASISLGNAGTTAGNLIIGGTGTTPTSGGLTTSRPILFNSTTGQSAIYANQTGANPVILNGAITTIATTGNVNLGGSNTADNIINTALPAGGAASGLTKVGAGTWVLNAANLYTGATNIQNGNLKLRATGGASNVIGEVAGNTIVFSADAVTQSAAGTLEFLGFLNTATTETLGALTPTAGAAKIVTVANGSGTAALTFTSLGTRGAGAYVDYQPGASTTISFTTLPTVTNGILGAASASAFQTFNGVDWATLSGSNVVQFAGYTVNALPASGVAGAAVNYSQSVNAATTGTASINTLKLIGGGSNPTVTLGGVLTLTGRAILFDNTSGTGTITGSQLGANATEVHVITNGASGANGGAAGVALTLGNALTINSLIGGTTGSFTKSGTGTLIVSGNNTFTGNAIINEGIVQLSGSTATLGVNSTAANLTTVRQGATLDINAAGASQTINVGALVGSGVITNSGGGVSTAGTISFGRSTSTGTTVFSGVLQDGVGTGGGVLNVTVDGTTARTQAFIGNNTYTGVTTIATGAQLTVDVLANGGPGNASGIGSSTSAAGNLVFNGAAPQLIYRGNIQNGSLTLGSASATTDRLFTISGAGAILSSTVTNNNAIVWSNTGAIVHGGADASRLVTLTGTSTGDNTFNPQLTDDNVGGGFITSLTKTGAGQWNLGAANNTYTGITTINEGILGLNNTGALPTNSPLLLAPTSATSVAVFQMSGTFDRSLAATATAGSSTVTFGGAVASTTGGVGFAAHSTALTVAIGGVGLPTALTWGSGGFVGTGAVQNLVLNSTTALSSVDFRNAIDLGASVRTINVLDNGNTGADYATMSGILSGTGGGILKIGSGVLRLTGANSYTSTTTVEAGTLVISSLGSSTGAATSGVGASGVTMDNTNAIVLGNATTTGGILQYVGTGETSDRKIRLRGTTAGNQIHADGSGALILTNVAHDTTETGDKTLSLRGSNTSGNMITSQLSNNGAGVLTVTVDGGATWILTNSANNYTGNTNANGGALGIGHDTALGAGTLVFNNGNVFAYGADRNIANAITHNNNTTAGFLGDYSLTFSSVLNLAASANNVTTTNSIVAGKTLTFNNGVTANALSANRAWIIDGPGETVINGDFTTTTAFGVRIDINGGGTLTLGTNGATSNFNQSITAFDVDRGTLKFSVNNAIPTTTAANGGITLSPEVATGDTATVDLNGTTQTVNAITATSNGTLVLDNTAATDATLRFGANNTDINFGGTSLGTVAGTGSYTITDSGAGALSIVKLGSTTTTFGNHVVLTHQGTTAVEGGTLNIAANLNGTTGLSVTNSGSALNLTGGITTPSAITSVIVENGGTLSLLDGVGSAITSLTNLQLGSSGGTMTTLNLNVGDLNVAGDGLSTDTLGLLTGGTLSLFAGNQITFNLTDTGLNANEQYVLLSAADGGLLGGSPLTIADYLLGATPGGFTSLDLTTNSTTNQIILTTGNLITGDSWWNAGGAADNWNDVANWAITDKTGTNPAASIPGQGTDVIFIADNIAGGAAISTTLEQNFKINSLTFEASTNPLDTPASVTIASGTLTTSRLEVAPQSATDGVAITAGGPPSVIISAPFRLGADQTWTVADAASVLTFSGGLQGEKNVTKAGLGRVSITAAADAAFNSGLTSDFTVTAGTLEITNNGALGSTANGNLADVIVNGGAFYFNGTGTTIANNLTLGGGTLSAGGGNQTYSGTVNVNGGSFINLRNNNGGTGETQERNITLSGAVSGSGNLTVSSDLTLSSGNAISGTLTFSNAANTWSGDLFINQGSVNFGALAGPAANNDISFLSLGKVAFQGVNGATLTRSGTLTYAAGAIGEFNADNTSGTLGANYLVEQDGAVSLGSFGTGASVRLFLADVASAIDIGGAVTLGGNSSISVAGGDADSFATISGIIGDGGSGYGLTVNDDAGGWAQTNTILRLTGANTFTGNVSLDSGTLEFDTVTNISGGASALGNGTAITTTNAATLRFIGASAQSTNRPITTAGGALTLSANGVAATDTITYNGAITIGPTGDGSQIVLTGAAAREGIITGGITQTGDTADMSVTGGTWTHQTGTTRIGDDMTVTGATTVLNLASGLFQVRDDLTVTAGATLNLNSTGALSYGTATLSADATLNISNGGVVNLGANDAIVATDFDRLFIAQNAGGATAILNMGAFNLTTSRFILGERLADRNGTINGTGTLTVTGGDIDLFEGTINANLASTGTATFEKFGPGLVTLAGDNSGLASTGTTIINEGTLTLDYTTSNTTKLRAASALEMIGSNLILNGNTSGATAQTVASYTVGNGGNNVITLNPGGAQTIVLNLNALTRALNAQDGTVRFNLPTGTQSATNGITTDTLNTIGTGTSAILGGWATVNDGTGAFFARNATNAADGNIVAANTTLQNAVASWLSGENISDSTGFTGTLGQDFTLNSLRFNAVAGSDLGLGAAGHLRLTSGGILVTDNAGGTPSITGGTLDTASVALPAASTELIVTQDSSATFEIGSNLHRAQNVTKSGTGTLLLSGTNTYTGYTEVQNGTLQLSGGNAVGDNSLVTLANNRNSTLQLLDDETIGRLQGGRRNDNSDYGMVDVGAHTLTINQGATGSVYSGRFTGSGTITMAAGGSGNFNYNGQTSTGLFTGSVVVNGALFQLSGASARLGSATAFTINGAGNFLIDNNDDNAPNDRISDSATFTLNSAAGPFSGTTQPRGLAIRTDNNANESETIGDLTFASGANYASLEASGGTSAVASLIAINWIRSNNATVNIRGRNLGGTANERAQFKIADANDTALIAANIGGGGVIGGTAKNVSIIPWAIGQSLSAGLAVTDMGNTFLSYVDNRGFVPLSLTSEFSTFGTATSGDNVRESLTTNLTGIPGATINSLILHNNNTAASTVNVTGTGAGQTLAVTSGAMLFTLNTAATASSAHSLVLGGFNAGITVGGSNEYVIHVVNPSSATTTPTLTATITSSLTSAADITKSGRGTLILNQTNTAGGGTKMTTINEGTLEIADLDNIGGGTGGLVFAGGALRLGAGFTDDISTRTVSFLTGGATLDTNGNNLVLANSIGGGGAGSFTKIGTGNLTVNAAANYSGATSYTDGTLTLGVNNALPSGTILTLNSGTTAATLDLNGFNQTLGGLTTTTNSALLTTQVIIDTGNTLTVNGAVLIGADAAPSTTLFTATGGGSFVQTQAGGTFQLGGGTGATNTNVATADFSGLANFTSDLGNTGVFRVGDNNSNASGSPNTNSTLTLAGTANTITAGILGIGDAQGQGGTATLELGGGTNVINADTVYIGAAYPSSRSSGALVFDGAGGSLTLRGSAGGTSRATVAMTTAAIGTGFNQVNTFLTANHTVDLKIGTFLMSERNAGTGSVTSTFDFNTGTLDVTNLVMSRRSGAGTGDSTSTVTIGGGTATIGSIDMASATGSGASSDAIATLNISGGTVAIGDGLNTGTAINLANAGGGRTVTSNVNLTGGTVTVTGNIIRTDGGGTENETLTLNGSTLNMSGNDIGTGAATVNFAAQSGTLIGLGELNGGGVLDKTTVGTLTLGNGNLYTGGTTVSAGVLLASNTSGSATGSGAVSVAATATLGGVGSIGGDTSIDGTLSTGAAVAPGTVGQMTFAGATTDVAFNNGSTWLVDVVQGVSPSNDSIAVGGNLTITGTTNLAFNLTGSHTPSQSYTIATYTGTRTGFFSNYNATGTYMIGGFDYYLDYGTGSNSTITLTAVPEPGTLTLLGLGLGSLIARRIRKRKAAQAA